jgi:hypothetical protein
MGHACAAQTRGLPRLRPTPVRSLDTASLFIHNTIVHLLQVALASASASSLSHFSHFFSMASAQSECNGSCFTSRRSLWLSISGTTAHLDCHGTARGVVLNEGRQWLNGWREGGGRVRCLTLPDGAVQRAAAAAAAAVWAAAPRSADRRRAGHMQSATYAAGCSDTRITTLSAAAAALALAVILVRWCL